MKQPGPLHYHHDRADLRGLAWLIGIGGLALLAITIPIIHDVASGPGGLITIAVLSLGWLGAWLVFAWRARRARGRADTVVFDETGFTSHLFGRVEFVHIARHVSGRDTRLWRWEHGAPSLKLRLADGRRLYFHLDARHYREDLLDYVAFVEAAQLGAWGEWHARGDNGICGNARVFGDPGDHHAPAEPTAAAPPVAPTPSAAAARHRPPETPPPDTAAQTGKTSDPRVHRARQTTAQSETHASHDTADNRADVDVDKDTSVSRLSRANREADQRDRDKMRRHLKWMPLAGAFLPLLIIIRSCDMSGIKSAFSPNPFNDRPERVSSGFNREGASTGASEPTDYAEFDSSAIGLDRAIADAGPVYLWDNASASEIKPVLVPNVQTRLVGLPALDGINLRGTMRAFLRNDAAEGYRMGLEHDETLTVSSYSQTSLRPVEGEQTLTFFVLPPAGIDFEEQFGRRLPDITWRIHYREPEEIPDKIEQASYMLPIPLLARWMQMTPPPRLMVAASRYHGMTDDAFEAAVARIKAAFEQRGVDMSRFETQRFADGATTQTTPADDADPAGGALPAPRTNTSEDRHARQ